MVDGEFDNELFAVVIRGIRLCRCCDAVFAVVETGHANLTVRPNGNAIGQCGFLRTPSVSRFVDRISRDAGRPFGSHQSKIGGDHVRQNCFCSKLTARNLRRDRLERLEQVNGAGRVHVVFPEIGAAVGYFPSLSFIIILSRCIRVVGRHGTHIEIDILVKILKDANGVDRGFGCRCLQLSRFVDSVCRDFFVELPAVIRLAVSKQDHNSFLLCTIQCLLSFVQAIIRRSRAASFQCANCSLQRSDTIRIYFCQLLDNLCIIIFVSALLIGIISFSIAILITRKFYNRNIAVRRVCRYVINKCGNRRFQCIEFCCICGLFVVKLRFRRIIRSLRLFYCCCFPI